MAKTTPDVPSGDGAQPLADQANTGADEMAGGPPPTPTTADAPADPTPTGSGEPAKQAVSGTASPAPGRVVVPSPEEYEMPDEYANESPVEKARAWVEAHPGLALLAAGVGGLVIGRILVGLAPDPEPETFSDRVEARAKQLRKQAKGSFEEAKDSAGTAAAASAAALSAAALALKEAAERGAHKAEDWFEDVPEKAEHFAEAGSEKAKEFADAIGDVVKVAVTGVVAKKAAEWVGKLKD